MRTIITLFTIVLLASGCGVMSDPEDVAVYLDFSESDYLALTDKQGGNSTNLLKVSSGEELTPVAFLNAELEFIDDKYFEIEIEEYYTLSENLICITGQFLLVDSSNLEKTVLNSLLVDKESGRIYDFEGHFPDPKSYYLGSEFIQSDDQNNLYFLSIATGRIYQISYQSDRYQISPYSPAEYQVYDFFIDRERNCFFRDFSYATKVILSNGKTINSPKSLQSFFYKGDILMANHHFDFLSVTVGDELIFSTKASMPDDVEMMYYRYRDDVAGKTFLMQKAYSSYTTGYFGLVYDDQTDSFKELYCEKSYFQNAMWVKEFSSNKILFASEDNNEIVICRMDSLISEGNTFFLPVIKAENFANDYNITDLRFKDARVLFTGEEINSGKTVLGEFNDKNDPRIISKIEDSTAKLLDHI